MSASEGERGGREVSAIYQVMVTRRESDIVANSAREIVIGLIVISLSAVVIYFSTSPR